MNPYSIIKSVAEYHGLTVEDVMEKGRKPNIDLVRHTIAYIMFHEFDMSKTDIGRVLNRNHATIISSLDRFNEITYPNQFKRLPEIIRS